MNSFCFSPCTRRNQTKAKTKKEDQRDKLRKMNEGQIILASLSEYVVYKQNAEAAKLIMNEMKLIVPVTIPLPILDLLSSNE